MFLNIKDVGPKPVQLGLCCMNTTLKEVKTPSLCGTKES